MAGLHRAVVDHLILVTDGAAAFFCDEILDAVVGFRRDAPFPPQIELLKGVRSNDVPAARIGDFLQATVLHYPTLFGKAWLLETAPTRGGFAVKQQFPALRLLFRCEDRKSTRLNSSH